MQKTSSAQDVYNFCILANTVTSNPEAATLCASSRLAQICIMPACVTAFCKTWSSQSQSNCAMHCASRRERGRAAGRGGGCGKGGKQLLTYWACTNDAKASRQLSQIEEGGIGQVRHNLEARYAGNPCCAPSGNDCTGEAQSLVAHCHAVLACKGSMTLQHQNCRDHDGAAAMLDISHAHNVVETVPGSDELD